MIGQGEFASDDVGQTARLKSPQHTTHSHLPFRRALPAISSDWVTAEDSGLRYVPQAPGHVPHSHSYHSNDIKEEPRNLAMYQESREYASRPFGAHGSPAQGDHHASSVISGSGNNRVSLEAPRHARYAAPRRDLHRGNQQSQSTSSMNRDRDMASYPILNARMSRDVNASPYFSARPSIGSNRSYRTANTEAMPGNDNVPQDETWSTLPVRRTLYGKKSPTISTKAFQLPGTLFGVSKAADTSKTSGPAQGSSDSATEVVIPLRRSKLTLFHPSPPKRYE